MKKASLLNDYLKRYATGHPWTLQAGSVENIEQIVVIPAYAEKDLLFTTLASIADNPHTLLETSLILCVVNHKAAAPDDDKENNAQTLQILNALIHQKPFSPFNCNGDVRKALQRVAESPLRLGSMDASSPGLEIPPHLGGVGMARKIGMDMALRLLGNSVNPPRLVLSLDADTVVEPNYLTAVRNAFISGKAQTGIVAYAHQMPADDLERIAICSYEIFLRYWVLGLQYAQSPYAFHSIGSTIVSTADSYLAVRGMNRREAGEDFYFLNKLAKISPIQQIRETIVYPSARVSRRVPFGTGVAIEKIVSGQKSDPLLYDPQIFVILKKWIHLMKDSSHRNPDRIIILAREIHEGLGAFLMTRGFLQIWTKIRNHVKNQKTYDRQFHTWFDGFETLKLVNYLTREYYPRVPQQAALETMIKMQDRKYPDGLIDQNSPTLQNQIRMLNYLRGVT